MGTSELELKIMSKVASSKFLEKNVPLNDTIVEMAKEAGLNEYQIARLCEGANLDTYNALFTKTGSGDFTFGLADQEAVVAGLNKSAGLLMPDYEMGASDLRSFVTTPKEEKSEEATKKEASVAEALTPVATIKPAQIRKTMNKLAYMLSELDSAIFEAKIAAHQSQVNLENMIKVAALRGEDIGPLYFVALSRCKDDSEARAVKTAFSDITVSLKKHGIDLVKAAKVYTEDAYGNSAGSGGSNTELKPSAKDFLIKSDHPFIKHIDTLVDNCRSIGVGSEKRRYLVRKVESLRSQLINKKDSFE